MLIPATVLTGFLGAGKTTLLKRVLSEDHGHKIAIIENEFGEENIDNDILVSDTKEHIVQMSNGCVCCTIREDLRTTLQELAEKKRKGELDFDRVVIETTGLADPGPVAQTFFIDDEIAVDKEGVRRPRLCLRVRGIKSDQRTNRGETDSRYLAAPYWRCIVHSVSTNITLFPGGVRRLILDCL